MTLNRSVRYLPTRRVHLKFDDYPREHGVIREDTKTDAVHAEWIETFNFMGIGIISMKTTTMILMAFEIGLESGLIWAIKTL